MNKFVLGALLGGIATVGIQASMPGLDGSNDYDSTSYNSNSYDSSSNPYESSDASSYGDSSDTEYMPSGTDSSASTTSDSSSSPSTDDSGITVVSGIGFTDPSAGSSSSSAPADIPAVSVTPTADSDSSTTDTSNATGSDDSSPVVPAVSSDSSGTTSDTITDSDDSDDSEQLDTTDVKSGNWVLKRAYLEKTEDVYEQIKDAVSAVLKVRINFFSERNDLDNKLNVFYGEIGVEVGPLQDIVMHSLDLLQADQKKDGDAFSSNDMQLLQSVKTKKRDLEQLLLDVKAIQELEQKIDDALNTVLNQVDVCEKYENRAWDNFKDMTRELDDKKAKNMYYETKGLLTDVNKVLDYLNGEFKTYFDTTLRSAQDHAEKIASQVHSFKLSGIDLKKYATGVPSSDPEPAASNSDTKPAPTTSGGFLSEIMGAISSFCSMISSGVITILGYILMPFKWVYGKIVS